MDRPAVSENRVEFSFVKGGGGPRTGRRRVRNIPALHTGGHVYGARGACLTGQPGAIGNDQAAGCCI